jgi:hypothetical protein
MSENKSSKFISWLKYSSKRYWPFFLLTIALPFFDKSILSVYIMLATVSVIIYISNLIRKELFPYIDLRLLIEKAKENAVGAGIVCAAVIYLIAVTIQACIVALK